MAKVTGLGGVFLRASDGDALYAWYETHLGLKRDANSGCFDFPAENRPASTSLAFFAKDTAYFPPAQPAMLNFQVDDLHAVLDRLQAAGVKTDPNRETHDYGSFGWFEDPEGNRVELWQPSS